VQLLTTGHEIYVLSGLQTSTRKMKVQNEFRFTWDVYKKFESDFHLYGSINTNTFSLLSISHKVNTRSTY